MTLLEFVENNGINTSHLARKIGLRPTTFINKINGRLNSKFTANEKEKVLGYLKELSIDISEFLKDGKI